MKIRTKQYGFSLTEVLMAVGILMVGLLLVAGTFPVGIHLTAVATERTLGAVAADEAFAKVQIYGVDTSTTSSLSPDYCEDFNNVLPSGINFNSKEFLYPSDSDADQVYNWSAICRKVNDYSDAVQLTVFVSRKVSQGLQYHDQAANYTPSGTTTRPVPVLLTGRSCGNNTNEISLSSGDEDYITDDSFVVIDQTGEIYRIYDIDWSSGNGVAYVDKKFPAAYSEFWVIPPPVDGGKSPCVGVYQRIIDF